MTLINKRTFASGIAAVAVGAGALLPFQAHEADAASKWRMCVQALSSKYWAIEQFDGGLGDSFWAIEAIYIQDWMNENC